MCVLNNIIAALVLLQIMLSLGVCVWLIATRGPRKSFDQQVKEMSEDGLKTYRR
jgi:hypothetical protein